MTKRDLALDLFKTFKTGVTRKPNHELGNQEIPN
jgi:hypothetical protein